MIIQIQPRGPCALNGRGGQPLGVRDLNSLKLGSSTSTQYLPSDNTAHHCHIYSFVGSAWLQWILSLKIRMPHGHSLLRHTKGLLLENLGLSRNPRRIASSHLHSTYERKPSTSSEQELFRQFIRLRNPSKAWMQ